MITCPVAFYKVCAPATWNCGHNWTFSFPRVFACEKGTSGQLAGEGVQRNSILYTCRNKSNSYICSISIPWNGTRRLRNYSLDIRDGKILNIDLHIITLLRLRKFGTNFLNSSDRRMKRLLDINLWFDTRNKFTKNREKAFFPKLIYSLIIYLSYWRRY